MADALGRLHIYLIFALNMKDADRRLIRPFGSKFHDGLGRSGCRCSYALARPCSAALFSGVSGERERDAGREADDGRRSIATGRDSN